MHGSELETIDWRQSHSNSSYLAILAFADHGATIKWLWQGLWHQETPLEKANSCFRVELNSVRGYSLLITPSFLTGVSIRFCSFEGANENVWHVLVRVTTGTTKFHLTVKFLVIAFLPMLILFSLLLIIFIFVIL